MKHWKILVVVLLIISCSRSKVTPPPFNPDTNLVNTTKPSDTIMRNMEGVYEISAGSQELGTEFVCRVSKKKVSFFSNHAGIYIILDYGLNPSDSSIQFSGFWRYSEAPTEGLIAFSIAKDQGASDLIENGIVHNLRLDGNILETGGNNQTISIRYDHAFSDYAKSSNFMIFAHHGVQTTSDPPYIENTVNGVLHDEDYGTTALEFDVHLTKDHIPICVHDPGISIRVEEKGPLYGDFIQYTFSFLQTYVTLKDGQKIPSVEQVLTAFVDSTNMKEMWLDIKGDPDIFKYLEPVVKNAYARAAAKNRDIKIIADIPSQKVIDLFHQYPSYADSLPIMCELSLQDCIDLHAQYFGPRYSLGLLLDDVDKAHSMGIRVYSWTLNSKDLILSYLQNGKFDGFITDYPAYVNYYYYTMF